MSNEFTGSPTPPLSNGSLSPVFSLADDNDALPMTNPYTIASAQIVPVADRIEVQPNDDNEYEFDVQKKKEQVVERFSIIADARIDIHKTSPPQSPVSDNGEDLDNKLVLPLPINYNNTASNSSIARNDSPGFTLRSINENVDSDCNASSQQIFKTQTSTFDMIAVEDMNSNKLSYQASASQQNPGLQVVHTHLDPNHPNHTNHMIHDNDEDGEQSDDEAPNYNSSSLPDQFTAVQTNTSSQDQVKTLTTYLMALSQDHQKLRTELENIFREKQKDNKTLQEDEGDSATATKPKASQPLNHAAFSHFVKNNINREFIEQNEELNKYKYDVAFLISQPLLHSTGSEVLSVEPLNCEEEEKAIQQAFSSSGRKINYIRKFATVNNLRELVTAGTSIIHYCGHGIRKALIFEADMAQQIGMSHRLSANHLRKLISAGQGHDANVSLVFVSACHSEDAGKAFINAGAKHVVAVRRTAEMHDVAAGTFTKQFYFALVNGKTVKQSFDIAAQSIQAQFVENNYLKNEAMKFVLLPKKTDHNVVLFDRAPSDHVVGKHLNHFIDHTTKRGMKKFPQPPIAEWVGRFKEIHDLMHNILSDNLVVISCDKGLGKTALLTRTLHYLWDRSLLSGIYYFDIYEILKKNPSLSIAECVAREMFPNLKQTTRMQNRRGANINNKEFIDRLITSGRSLLTDQSSYLIVFEDIDLFEYEHLAEDQRIDIFIEEILAQCDNIKLVLTLGTPVNQCSFLHNLDKRIVKLRPLPHEESIKLLEIYLQKHFSLPKIRNGIPLEKIASFCKGYPSLIKFAASLFQNDDDLNNLNLRKQLREQVLTQYENNKMTRYWKELSIQRGRLRIGELKKHIRERDGQKLWEEMYGYRSRGLLNTLLYRMKEWYREHVGDTQFKLRPIWTYYELEFIQMELLPFLAKSCKQTFKAPKEVVQRLETLEEDIDACDDRWKKDGRDANKKKKKWYHAFKKDNNKKVKEDNNKKHKINNRNYAMDQDDDKVSEEEKVPIEVFAEFFAFWKELWKTMMEPKVSPFYFKKDNEICLIAGMMKKERALSIISQYAKGTFLIRFSKQNAGSLVLVVSTGPDQKPSQHKIHINKNIDDGSVTFEYQTVRKGIHRSQSLYDLFNHLQFLEHLWFKKRGKDQDYIEKDKRKILKYFKSRADVWKL